MAGNPGYGGYNHSGYDDGLGPGYPPPNPAFVSPYPRVQLQTPYPGYGAHPAPPQQPHLGGTAAPALKRAEEEKTKKQDGYEVHPKNACKSFVLTIFLISVVS